jgi:DNA-binding transcriptional LysR family regulator
MTSPIEPDSPSTVVESSTTLLLPQLAAFLAVVDAGSFSAAARRTRSDKSVLSRRVRALEDALGVRLLNRTTRSLDVTAAGRRLVDDAGNPITDALAALVRTGAPDHLEGTVRVASAQSLAQSVLVPVLAALREAHPRLRVEFGTTESMTPLVDQGYELGIRVGRMPDSNLIARKLAAWRYLLVASPGWIADHRDVAGPADLMPHWLLWGQGPQAQRWSFQRDDEDLDVRMDASLFLCDTSQVLLESARAGLGVAAMPPFCVARELAEGSLVRLLPEWRITHELGIFGVTPHRTMLPARVQVVLEAVRVRLAELAPAWERLTG